MDSLYNFKPLVKLTPQKIVWHLRNKEIVFLVCKNPDNQKYTIVSFRLRIIKGKERVVVWDAQHTERVSSNMSRSVTVQAADYQEWLNLLEIGYNSTHPAYFSGPSAEYFKWGVFGGEEYYMPKDAELYAYTSDKVSAFGKGIEQVFAEYWFTSELPRIFPMV